MRRQGTADRQLGETGLSPGQQERDNGAAGRVCACVCGVWDNRRWSVGGAGSGIIGQATGRKREKIEKEDVELNL